MQTVIGAFDDRAQAQRAVDQLVQGGFDRQDVHIEQQEGGSTGGSTTSSTMSQPMTDHHPVGGIGHFFAHLFGTDKDERHSDQADTYHEAVRRGSSVVVVDARDDQEAERAVTCLHDAGAINVDERAQQWRQEGWTGGSGIRQQADPLQSSTGGTGASTTMATGGAMAQPDTMQRTGGAQGKGMTGSSGTTGGAGMGTTASTGSGSGMRDDAPPVGKEGVLDVVQEELKVGKRQLDKGGVRVIQRVTEKPVREVVRLREEHAIVDRHPVDRPAEAGDMNTFREGTLEVRETAEEPVVAKTARVVEEVRVGKQVNEREETIEDRVRRKDVDVERMGGEQRERAVASNTREPVQGDRSGVRESMQGDRDPDTRLRKNDPSS